jgi:hypothetical protein
MLCNTLIGLSLPPLLQFAKTDNAKWLKKQLSVASPRRRAVIGSFKNRCAAKSLRGEL